VGLSAKRNTAGGKLSIGKKVKFLVVLPTADIKAIKPRAIDRGVNASGILAEAAATWQ
jgi:hypothetical protein